MIGFSVSRTSWLSRPITFFTRTKWSHCFVMGPALEGYATVIEASELVAIVPYIRNYKTNPNEGYEIWDCVAASTTAKQRAFARCFYELSGKQYGFLQLLWFVWRWLSETVFKKTPKGNWVPSGVICSELNWHYLMFLGDQYAELVKDLDPNTTHCGDLYSRVVKRPDLFKLVETKELGQ